MQLCNFLERREASLPNHSKMKKQSTDLMSTGRRTAWRKRSGKSDSTSSSVLLHHHLESSITISLHSCTLLSSGTEGSRTSFAAAIKSRTIRNSN